MDPTVNALAFDPNAVQPGGPQQGLTPPGAAPGAPQPVQQAGGDPNDLQARADALLKAGTISSEQYNKLMQAMGKGGGFQTGVKAPNIAGGGNMHDLGVSAGHMAGAAGQGLAKLAGNALTGGAGGSGMGGSPSDSYAPLAGETPSPQWNQ